MSHIVLPFEVSSKALLETARVRFVQLISAIATRHSDTIDCIFLVDGQKVTVAISCAALTELRERDHIYFTDQQLAEIAAAILRRTLEQGYDATQAELFVRREDLMAVGRELGFL
jgi:hypothetical protein